MCCKKRTSWRKSYSRCLQDVIEDLNADNFDHSELDFIGGAQSAIQRGQRGTCRR